MAVGAAGAAFVFFYRPFSLGPEPGAALPESFFEPPTGPPPGLRLLYGGGEAFEAIFEIIGKAERSITVQTFIWEMDDTGARMAGALLAAADRGARVVIRKDMTGVYFELQTMLRKGIRPALLDPRIRRNPNIDVRLNILGSADHSKYYIADGRRAVFGGMNITDNCRLRWRDYMVMIDSAEWAAGFERKVLDDEIWPEEAPFRILTNSRRALEIRPALSQAFSRARESVILDHAYFSDETMISAVMEAARRGVKVTLILPRSPDTHGLANLATVNRLLASLPPERLEVYLNSRMSHAKAALIDGAIAFVGSANLTHRSMRRSRETVLALHGRPDDPFIAKLREKMLESMAESERVTAPFELGAVGRVRALVGKYTW